MTPDEYERAACRGKPAAWFYPEQHDAHPGAEARLVCASCPVQAPCLEDALDGNEPGFWAGTSREQRVKLRRGRPVNRSCTICGATFTATSHKNRVCSAACRTESHRQSTNRTRRAMHPEKYPSFTDEQSVLAITVLVALDAPAVSPAVKARARELIRGGAPWGRVAEYLIQATKEEAA